MSTVDRHLSERELLLVADGELPAYRQDTVEAHLVACSVCRSRVREITVTESEFFEARYQVADHVPSSETSRANFQQRLTELAAQRPASSRRWNLRQLAAVAAVLIFVIAGTLLSSSWGNRPARDPVSRSLPDPQLTPGAVLPVSQSAVCSVSLSETARIVPASVARQVFDAYGIRNPKPRTYELDYLITPALGGSDTVQNFWPQPYRNTVWTAHLKDALEDHLRALVCSGQVELAVAQRDIAQDWIGAYRKYFGTDRPLPAHAEYLRDQPWE